MTPSESSFARCLIDLVMTCFDIGRPLGFDPREHSNYFVVAQHTAIDGHGGLVVRLVDELGKAKLRNRKQLRVRVMPGMAARIVRRSGQQAIRTTFTPIGLTFSPRPMTGRAVLGVDASTNTHNLRIVWTQRVTCPL